MFCALSQKYQHFFGNASYSKFSKKHKNGIENLDRQVVFNLWIKTVKMLFASITQERLALNVDVIFEFLGQFTIRCIYFFFKKVLMILRWSTKMLIQFLLKLPIVLLRWTDTTYFIHVCRLSFADNKVVLV